MGLAHEYEKGVNASDQSFLCASDQGYGLVETGGAGPPGCH